MRVLRARTEFCLVDVYDTQPSSRATTSPKPNGSNITIDGTCGIETTAFISARHAKVQIQEDNPNRTGYLKPTLMSCARTLDGSAIVL